MSKWLEPANISTVSLSLPRNHQPDEDLRIALPEKDDFLCLTFNTGEYI